MYDIAIIGSGPAGLAAGIYAKRAGLNCLILDASPVSGGQILNTYEVDNYPGLPGISGMDMGKEMRAHCDKLGVEFKTGRISSIERCCLDDSSKSNENFNSVFKLTSRKFEIETRSVIIATGASNSKLGAAGEEELCGMGVSYCATCDGAFFKEKTVAVVGGGDVALEDALYLARGCKKVYLIHRRDEFRGAAILVDEVKSTANIELVLDSTVESINANADGMVGSCDIYNKKTGLKKQLEIDGIFIAVGTKPNTGSIAGLPDMDERGYIIAEEDGQTSVPGIFAAGDVRTKQLRQVVTAVADGANCVTSAERYLRDKA